MRLPLLVLPLLVLPLVTVSPGPASGFAEDVCPQRGGGWTTCPAVEKLVPLPGSEGARSTVHTDATYVIAQALGMTPRQAMVLASYDDGVDLGSYVHRDRSGAREPAFDTPEIAGVARSNFFGGGVFFHFMVPVTGPAPVEPGPVVAQHAAARGYALRRPHGLRPAIRAARANPVLANARRWAYGRGPLCVAGLTVRSRRGDYATGSQCYRRPDGTRAKMLTSLPLTSQPADVSELDFLTPLGEVRLTARGADHPVLASRIARITGRRDAPLVRFAIYLHAAQDRVSHHRCIDASYAVGPRPLGSPPVVVNPAGIVVTGAATAPTPQVGGSPTLTRPDFLTTFAPSICDQLHHGQLHGEETGTDQSTLAPRDRTLAAGLRLTVREVRRFVTSPYGRRVLGGVARPHGAHGLVRQLVAAESVVDPAARLDALAAVATTRDLRPMPGY